MSNDGSRALRDLRRARRRRAYGDLDWTDALYKAYVTALAIEDGRLVYDGPADSAEVARLLSA